MPKIAVVQDGTELARQTDADITGCFEECCALLSADGPSFTSEVFMDEEARFLLDGLDPREHQCLVITSNALTSGRIEQIVERQSGHVRDYLQAGGGLIVLHQLCDSLSSVLPSDVCPELTSRQSKRGSSTVAARDQEDILLHYPTTVDVGAYADGGPVGPPSLFYKSIVSSTLPEQLKRVLSWDEEVLLVRTWDHVPTRMVVTTLPLDWQRAVPLLSNAIRFAALGPPKRLVWLDDVVSRRALLTRWLALDGGASVRPLPNDDAPLQDPEAWLLRNVDLVVLPLDHLDTIEKRPEVESFLSHGGTLVSSDVEHRPGNQVTAVVGAWTERQVVRRLYAELRVVPDWKATDYAFELRNIVSALAFLWENQANHSSAAVAPRELAPLRSQLRTRLTNPRDREDISSSIVHAQTLAHLSPAQVDSALVDWMMEDRRTDRVDVALQIRAVRAVARRKPDATLASDMLTVIENADNTLSLAAVVRLLDALAIADQGGVLKAPGDVISRLTASICTRLERDEPDEEIGWLSVEGTSDVTLGLVALLSSLGPGDQELERRVTQLLGSAFIVLRRAVPRYERDRWGVAWLARVTHAIVAIDRCFPMGLQRLASIDWPEQGADDTTTKGGGALLDHLTNGIKQLRDREQEFDDARLAAKVGRGAATIGAVAVIALPLVWFVVVVGFDSVRGLLANISVVLAFLFAVVGGAFSLLERRHLLAGPAVRIKGWVQRGLEPLTGLLKIDRK
ncbi:MAG TPA: hypothetical protein VHI95_08730 [Acidimicrobiales bacterium]|nr:hypothetical protein [Acidimicrobiales bacterium]